MTVSCTPLHACAARQDGYSLLEVMLVVALMGVIAAIAIPMGGNTLANFRLSGDARTLSNTVSLAKMRAASGFTQSRVYVDLSGGTFHLETRSTSGTPAWTAEGGTIALSSGVSFSYGVLGTPPPNTQSTIGPAALCKTIAGADIANTACILYNSRGIPIDSTGAPTGADALYITDGTAVYGVTVSATGLSQLWRSGPSTASWVKQ